MRSFPGCAVSIGMIVALAVSPAALAFPIEPPGLVEGPAWWTKCEGYMHEVHAICTGPALEKVHLEVTALSATSATFVGHVKPIAGAPVTHWEIGVEGPWCPDVIRGEVAFESCFEHGRELYETARIASGEIVGGNPEEFVTVSGSTSTATEPLALLPGHAYLAGIGAEELTVAENPTGELHDTWGSETIGLITAPDPPTESPQQARREKLKREREARRQKRAEARKRKQEERKHKKG